MGNERKKLKALPVIQNRILHEQWKLWLKQMGVVSFLFIHFNPKQVG